MITLFDPVRIGAWELPNRILMAPLTRARAGAARLPNALMAEYYTQRASAGMIISEATSVSPMGVGYADTPGIWSDEQVEGWKRVTRGRAPGRRPDSPPALARGPHVRPDVLKRRPARRPERDRAAGHVSLVRPLKPFVTPRALELDEIPGIVEAYRKGAENAQRAGFDGVEIHGANGYLLDQFLQDKTNHRQDAYGGPVENRARLMLEVTDAVVSVWGPDRVGMHLAPRGDAHDMGDSTRWPRSPMSPVNLANAASPFICARESLGKGRIGPQLKAAFGGRYIANEQFTFETANQVLAAGEADAIAFGVPSWLTRTCRDASGTAPLNTPDQSTFYAPGPKGYTDYPALGS